MEKTSTRVLALDLGERRIGVAISDPTRTLARSLCVLERRSRQEDFAAIAEFVREHEVGLVLVGYPRSLDGTVGPQARRTSNYADELAQTLSVPLVLWDERLSTVTAEQLMIESGRSARKRRKWIDAVAAAIILQDYLDAQSPEDSDLS
ncbi:MAG: Holliday junction resolvase RuvX [Chloroflexota bacterium]|nr:Holliday junction resolvase RuvX [Chloroflexota bacterium]